MKKFLSLIIILVLVTASCSNHEELSNNPTSSFAHYYTLGMSAFEKGDYNEAILQFKRSLELKSDVARTHNELGLSYLFINDYDNAISHLERALSIDAKMIEVHNNLGAAYLAKKNYDMAENHFLMLLRSPDYTTKFNPLYNLGNLNMGKKEFDKALAYYTSALESDIKIPNDHLLYIHFQIGNIYFERKEFKLSNDSYEEVLLLNPQLFEAIYKSGICALNLGQKERAEQKFRKVITLSPDSEWAEKAMHKMKELNW